MPSASARKVRRDAASPAPNREWPCGPVALVALGCTRVVIDGPAALAYDPMPDSVIPPDGWNLSSSRERVAEHVRAETSI